ncbi:MAG: ATP--guanido phosphotransferase [Puniceicoccales bacterium]|jgi:protein arginine kinase|nr:ATP--guanido phosphotransferase [Puniceicoccales bacterium]
MNELRKVLFRDDQETTSMPIVISSRIRLARNLKGYKFPRHSTRMELSRVAETCKSILLGCKLLKDPKIFAIDSLSATERCALVEAHLCSIELSKSEFGAGLLVANGNSSAVMFNEEDHLRLQIFRQDLDFKTMWLRISEFDDYIAHSTNIAYDANFGFLTSCPTNVGTGMRSSVMLHLPGLVITSQVNVVINAVQKLGFVVRGLFGEGTSASGSIFQISNQYTLGLSEIDIISRLYQVIISVIANEELARKWLLKNKSLAVCDNIGRSFGALSWSHTMGSEEAISHLSNMRLAVDYGFLPQAWRAGLDCLLVNVQPSHIQLANDKQLSTEERNIQRATAIRKFFEKMPSLKF